MRFADSDGDPSFDALKRGIMKLEATAESVVRRCDGQASLRKELSVTPSFWLIGRPNDRISKAF
jgi:hypothetical protein